MIYFSEKLKKWVIRDPVKKKYITMTPEELVGMRVALSSIDVVVMRISNPDKDTTVIQIGSDEVVKEIDMSKFHKLDDFGLVDRRKSNGQG